jgi:hypothetical protein
MLQLVHYVLQASRLPHRFLLRGLDVGSGRARRHLLIAKLPQRRRPRSQRSAQAGDLGVVPLTGTRKLEGGNMARKLEGG